MTTTPTPEATQAAARAIQDAGIALHPKACARFATAALSAAYPLMEVQAKAEALREAADELWGMPPKLKFDYVAHLRARADQEEFLAQAIADPEGRRLADAAAALATPGLGNWPTPDQAAPKTAPKRIQRQRTKGWRKPEGAVYVGRGNHWGNPYRVEDHGRQGAVDIYRADLNHSYAGPGIFKKLRDELRGKDLMCWCPLDQPCHADVLLELANQDPE